MSITLPSTAVLEACRSREGAIVADLGRLIAVESPSGDAEAVARSAVAVADLIATVVGTAPEVLVVDGVSHVRLRFGTPRVLVLAHHDTVWPLGTLDHIPFTVEDGMIRGPGCFDMKAGLTQALHALAVLRDLGGASALDGIELLVTGDEEIGSPTSRAIIEEDARACSAAFVLEASGDGGALKTERKGTSMYRVTVLGRAAHAGLEPEKGINAAVAIAGLLPEVVAMGDPLQGTTVTPTVLSAGTTSNTVPAEGFVDIDVRVRTRAEQERVDKAIRSLRAPLPGSELVVSGGPNRPPLEADMTAQLFALAGEVSSRLGIPRPRSVAVGGASDGNFTAGIGVPTLDGMGAVGGGAHAKSEHALVDWIVPRTAMLTEMIREVLARSLRSA